jgi:DNA-directed RNA polymerase specialized sigma24 family protein
VTLPPFQSLVDEHWRDVARFARALAGPVDGADVAQQAWTNALAAYPKLRSSANLRGWLLTITSRCATDVHRSRTRRAVPVAEPALVADSGRTGFGRAAADPVDPPDEAVWEAVRALPERQRIAVTLKYVADYDHAAVARHLGTTPAASRRLVADALATLRATTNPRSPR